MSLELHALKIATAPVNWNNDDIPGWREPEPFPDLLDRMVEAGYRATEYDDKIGPEPVQVGAAVTARGIELCGFYQWMDLQDDENLRADLTTVEARLAQLGDLGCRHLIIADRLRPERDAIAGRVPADGSASLEPDAFTALVERADHVAMVAERYGFATHYHHHVGTYVESPLEVAMFARLAAGMRIDFCFDSGHYAFAGGDARTFVAEHGDAIGHLHLKDVDTNILAGVRAAGQSFRDALRQIVFPPIGTGDAGIESIVVSLVAHRFPHWVVIEQDTCAGDRTATARANRLAVERFAANARRTAHD